MSTLLLATSPGPLFGNPWLALLAVLAGVAIFMAAVAGIGHWLAATHPDTPQPAPLAVTHRDEHIAPEILAVIAAAVATRIGPRARITAINTAQPAPSVEMLMQQWSLEGRRQIYSSHKIR